MKRLIYLIVPFSIIFVNSCDVFNSSDVGPRLRYQFKTSQTDFAPNDTLRATFKNKSTQTIYLHYQSCSITELQALKHNRWKSIPIPIVCTLETKPPGQVETGKALAIKIPLSFFHKKQLKLGLYRFSVSASWDDGNNQIQLTSDSFQIIN